MASTSDASESPSERQRGKYRKFRGKTTVLTSILRIGSSRGRNDKITVVSSPSVTSQNGANGSSRRSGVEGRRSSKCLHRHHTCPSSLSSPTYNVFHPRIPPFPGTYFTTMNTSIPTVAVHSIPSPTHIPLGHHASHTSVHMNSMSTPPEQTYFLPSHGYSQHMPVTNQHNQHPMSYSMGPTHPSPISHTNLQSCMYMKAYLRDPWSNDGFRLMILLPVGHRDDGTYGILNAGVKPEQVYSLCFYYADSILYYTLPDDARLYYIAS